MFMMYNVLLYVLNYYTTRSQIVRISQKTDKGSNFHKGIPRSMKKNGRDIKIWIRILQNVDDDKKNNGAVAKLMIISIKSK